MTTTKLLDLLREARKLINTTLDIDALHDWACESDGDEPALDDAMRALRTNIDAALDAYDAAPARPEWVVGSWCHYPSRASSYRMGLPNTNIEVRRKRDGKWSFLVTRQGLKDTLEEAQAAALDAAKEMA